MLGRHQEYDFLARQGYSDGKVGVAWHSNLLHSRTSKKILDIWEHSEHCMVIYLPFICQFLYFLYRCFVKFGFLWAFQKVSKAQVFKCQEKTHSCFVSITCDMQKSSKIIRTKWMMDSWGGWHQVTPKKHVKSTIETTKRSLLFSQTCLRFRSVKQNDNSPRSLLSLFTNDI